MRLICAVFIYRRKRNLKASAPGGKSQIGSTDNLDGFATSGHDIYAGGQTAQIKR